MISVVTITYNNYDELVETLQSIPKSPLIESIVINGGSCERTKRFLDNYDGVSVSEPDDGIADAFNKGLLLSNGEYILFLNSGDCLISSHYLLNAKKALDNDSSSGFAHANIIFIDEFAGELLFRHTGKNIGAGMPYFHQTMLVRKSVFDRIGTFNTSYKIAMDYDFVVRMLRNNILGIYLDDVSVKMDGKGISANKEFLSVKECRRSLIENNMYQLTTRYYLTLRLVKLSLRKFIYTLFGDKLLKKFKQIKYEHNHSN